MNKPFDIAKERLSAPMTYGVEAYLSPEFIELERDKVWRKVWLEAGRVEEIPNVGDFISYEILDDSVLIVRASETEIKAYHNVCVHRGRRLVDIPSRARNAEGRTHEFVCGYHGWQYSLNGENTRIDNAEDWQGQLTKECTSLKPVKCDTWGGWIWINMDPECEHLRDSAIPSFLR